MRQAYAEYRRGRSGSSELLQTPLLETRQAGDWQLLKTLIGTQWLNVLLVFSPLGILAGHWEWGSDWRFWLNFVALIPLANLLGDATEELADALKNQTLGGLVNATFGNAVEMILTYQTVVQGLLTVAKGSLLGSILSNLLLVLGMAFFAGGLGARGKEQQFKETGPMASISMLFVACVAFAVPTCFALAGSGADHGAEDVLTLSRGTAVAVLASYVCYIFFQVYTHQAVFEDGAASSEEGGECLSVRASSAVLAVATGLTAWNSEVLVDSIEPFVAATGISQAFIGVIILPIIGNACEHFAAIRMAVKDKPTLAIGIAVGSSAQIALFVFPLAVIFGWVLNVPLDLDLGVLNVVVLTLAVLIVFSILVDGKTNWLEGLMLIVVYLIVALAYYLS